MSEREMTPEEHERRVEAGKKAAETRRKNERAARETELRTPDPVLQEIHRQQAPNPNMPDPAQPYVPSGMDPNPVIPEEEF